MNASKNIEVYLIKRKLIQFYDWDKVAPLKPIPPILKSTKSERLNDEWHAVDPAFAQRSTE